MVQNSNDTKEYIMKSKSLYYLSSATPFPSSEIITVVIHLLPSREMHVLTYRYKNISWSFILFLIFNIKLKYNRHTTSY